MMFAISWYTHWLQSVLASCSAAYVGSRRVTKDWGDAMCGLKLSQARDAIQRLPHDSLLVHRKNWRPQNFNFVQTSSIELDFVTKTFSSTLGFCFPTETESRATVVRSLIDGDPLNEKVVEETVRVSKLFERYCATSQTRRILACHDPSRGILRAGRDDTGSRSCCLDTKLCTCVVAFLGIES